MKKFSLLSLVLLLSISFAFAQSHAKKGDYSFLKGEKSLSLKYEYSDMIVGKKLSEQEYVNGKVEAYNKKEAGKGDKWKTAWINSREDRYQPKFEILINKTLSKVNIKVSETADSKYTLIVKTLYTEPGFHVGIMKKPAWANFEFIFIETETKKEVSRYLLSRVPGSQAMGYDYDSGSRIAECYAKGGKMLGAYIYKGLK